MAPSTKPSEVTSSLKNLSLEPLQKKTPGKKTKTPKVADSWEDEDSSSSSEDDATNTAQPETPLSPSHPVAGSQAPPPTPISPTSSTTPFSPSSGRLSREGPLPPSTTGASSASQPDDQRRRPEKTDAVARRMIASALGVRAPRQTEEQKAYDRSVREQERKRREQEKAAEAKRQEEAEKAKAAMWDG